MSFLKKSLPETTIEVLCQNTGKTFRIYTAQAKKTLTCRACGKEAFEVHLGTGHGNVQVKYIDGAGAERWLSKVESKSRHVKLTLATVTADGGTFILIEQNE